ncbi:putative reverse transcriptase domain-containing protein [Tanacetum coccineum]
MNAKNRKYKWGREQEEAFQTLKDNLCNAPILSLPDGPEDFVVYCDASNQGLGCVLMQRGKSSVKDKILAAPGEASKVENATAKMMRGLDQLMERKEDGADKPYNDLRDMYGGHVKATTSKTLWVYCNNKRIPDGNRNRITMTIIPRRRLKMEKLQGIYIDEIVAMHGSVPCHSFEIVMDWITSRFLANMTESLRYVIGIMSTGFIIPDGWTTVSITIQTLEDKLNDAPFKALVWKENIVTSSWAVFSLK